MPSRYRCRKNKKLLDSEKLEYHCTVTDYKLESKGETEGTNSKEKFGNSKEGSDLDRCKELLRWQSNFQADRTEGKSTFWGFLTTAHEGFASLEKLKTHSLNYGTGTGKVSGKSLPRACRTLEPKLS